MIPGSNCTRAGRKLGRIAALFLGVAVLWPGSVARGEQGPALKRILVLYWEGKDFPGNVKFDRSFQAGLLSAPAGTVEYYSEYLESNRFPGEDQALVLRDYLRQKYAQRHIDVVVAVSDVALDFLLKYRSGLFTQTPLVYVGVKPPGLKDRAAGPGLTGIFAKSDYRGTIDLIMRLHPGTEQVAVISSSPERDRLFETQCREALQGYEGGASITYLTDLPLSEVIDKARALPPRSVILYVYQQAKDEQGRMLQTEDVLDLIVRSSRVPIYGIASWQVGKGIVGGYLRMNEANGSRAAEVALRIAGGTSAHDIPIEMVPVVPIFDWRELKRWGIDEANLPPGSIVEFRVPSFWDQYKWYGIGATAALVVQSLLIAGLVINRRRRKRAELERQVAQSEVAKNRARLAAVVGSAMDAIISIDESERIELFNDAAQKMFGCSEQAAIGLPFDRFISERFRNGSRKHVGGSGLTEEANRTPEQSGQIYGLRADGQEFPIEISISEVNSDGQRHYTAIVRDITERLNAERDLRASEASFKHG